MIKKIASVSLIIFVFFAPANPHILAEYMMPLPGNMVDNGFQEAETIYISENRIWRKNDNLIFDKNIVVINGATLTIEKGAKVIFRQAGLPNPMLMLKLKAIDGRIVAVGDTREKITFVSENDTRFNISIDSNDYESFFRYVKIIGGGMAGMVMTRNFFNITYAQSIFDYPGSASLEINGGKLHLENSEFIDSIYADIKVNSGKINEENGGTINVFLPEIEIINNNFSNKNAVIANHCNEYGSLDDDDLDMPACKNRVYLKNNWCKYENCLNGDYKLDSFRKNKMIVDPVIFIPGILGSAYNLKGELELDPIWHKYDDIVESLQKNGFKKDIDFFLFPYNWRISNSDTAVVLKNKIRQIKEQTKISKVDLVVHSMGGLVARSYAERDNYADNIDQIIFLGTPHRGAPKAYLMWEAGEGYNFLLKRHLNHEAEEKGYNNLYEYVQEKISSVHELLPDYDYLFDAKNNKLRKYYNNYPRNEFLEILNQTENFEKLSGLDIFNFVGKMKNNKTIGEIKIVKKGNKKWMHGSPENLSGEIEENLSKVDGDGTVPLFSARGEFSESIELDAKHIALPTKAQCDIFYRLTNKNKGCKYVDRWDNINLLLFQVFSPVDIQVVAPNGERVGKNFEKGEIYNEIEGAYYTGYNTATEFLTIPNPQIGEYKILTQGTDNGDYRIEATYIYQNENEAQERQVVFQANTKNGEEKEHLFTLESNSELKTNDAKTNEDSNEQGVDNNTTAETATDDEQTVENNNNEQQNTENDEQEISSVEDKNSSNKKDKQKNKKQVRGAQSEIVKVAEAGNENTENLFSNHYFPVEDGNKGEVKGEEIEAETDLSEKENNNSFIAFLAVIATGILLVVGVLVGLLKKKDEEKDADFGKRK